MKNKKKKKPAGPVVKRFTVTFSEVQAAALEHEAAEAGREESSPVAVSTIVRRAVSHYLAFLDGDTKAATS